jgi:Icc protein
MSFSFVQITDHHLTESEATLLHGFSTTYSFRAVMRHIAQTIGDRADFIVSTGDLVEPSPSAAYPALRRTLNIGSYTTRAPGPLPVSIEGLHEFPMYLFPGNHDDRSLLLQTVFVDWGPDAKAVAAPGMFEFLAQALESDLPSVILMHHHPVPVQARWLDKFIADDIERFWEVVAGRPVLGIFCGHVHMTHETVVEGIPVFSLRSTMFQFAAQDTPLLCLQPPHYRLVTIQDGVLTTKLFEVPL